MVTGNELESPIAKSGESKGEVVSKAKTEEQIFGERLLALRTKKGLTQPEAAEGCGCGARSLWRWENGEKMPSAKNLKKLVNFYGTTKGALLK